MSVIQQESICTASVTEINVARNRRIYDIFISIAAHYVVLKREQLKNMIFCNTFKMNTKRRTFFTLHIRIPVKIHCFAAKITVLALMCIHNYDI